MGKELSGNEGFNGLSKGVSVGGDDEVALVLSGFVVVLMLGLNVGNMF